MQGRGKSFEQLLDESLDLHVQDGVILPNLKMAGEKEQCVYLNEKGRCSIHPFRPGICRLFPLGRFYENGSFRYFLQTKECSRENRTKQKIRKWIDMPEFGRYETFVADWHFFVRRLQDRLMQQSDMEAAQRINRYILQEFYFRGWDAEQNFYDQFSERLKKAQKVLAQIEHTYYHKTTDRTNVRTNQTKFRNLCLRNGVQDEDHAGNVPDGEAEYSE